jgi:hypothetical protein
MLINCVQIADADLPAKDSPPVNVMPGLTRHPQPIMKLIVVAGFIKHAITYCPIKYWGHRVKPGVTLIICVLVANAIMPDKDSPPVNVMPGLTRHPPSFMRTILI